MTMMKIRDREFSQKFLRDWSELIGPEYASALLPGRLALIFGIPFFCF
jgi:hypothetical protein